MIYGKNIRPFGSGPATEYVDFVAEAIKSGGREDVDEQDRLGVRQIGRTPVETHVPAGLFSFNTIYSDYFSEGTYLSLKFVLGALRCSVHLWYRDHHSFDRKSTFPKIKKRSLLSFPVTVPKPGNRRAVRGEGMVRRLLHLDLDYTKSRTVVGRSALERQILHARKKLDEAYEEAHGRPTSELVVIRPFVTIPGPDSGLRMVKEVADPRLHITKALPLSLTSFAPGSTAQSAAPATPER